MRDTLKIAVIVGALLMIAAGTSQLIVTDGSLTGNGSTANPLRVVTSVMQSRVTGTCTTPNAIDVINSDGTVTCSTGVLNTSNVSGTTNQVAKFTSTNVVGNSNVFENGSVMTTSDKAMIGASSTPVAQLSVASADSGTALAAGLWDTKWTTFGPNVGNSNGASSGAIGIGYSTTSDEAQITVGAPSYSWKPLRVNALSYAFEVSGASTTGLQIDSTGKAIELNAFQQNVGDFITNNTSGTFYTQRDAVLNNLSGNTTVGGNLRLSQAGDDYLYSSLATSTGNQQLNIFAAGTGKILFQSGHGGVTNAGTGGLELDGGGSSTTSVWSVTNGGATTQSGSETIITGGGSSLGPYAGGTLFTMDVGGGAAAFMTLATTSYKGLLFANASSVADGGVIYDASARGLTLRSGGNVDGFLLDSTHNVTIYNNETVNGNTVTVGTTALSTSGKVTTAGGDFNSVNEYGMGDYTSISTLVYAGFYRKNLALFSLDLSGASGLNNGWAVNTNGNTLAYTAGSFDVTAPSSWGVSSGGGGVGKLVCTDGGTACSAGGSDYRTLMNSTSTHWTSMQSQTVTFSVWVRTASGTNANFTLKLARYSDNDLGSTTCSVSTTWTRCSLTRTFSATSYADNSEIRAYVQPMLATTAHYLYAAQIEVAGAASPYEMALTQTASQAGSPWSHSSSPPSYVSSSSSTGDISNGVWSQGGFAAGNTTLDPYTVITNDGTIYQANGTATLKNTTVSGTLGVTGGITSTGGTNTLGQIVESTQTTSSSSSALVNDFALGANTLLLKWNATTAIPQWTGMAGGGNGRVVFVQNTGTVSIQIYEGNANSLAANRFTSDSTPGAEYLTPGSLAMMIYDSGASLWSVAIFNATNTPAGLTVNGQLSVTNTTTLSGAFNVNGTTMTEGAGTATIHITDKDGTARPTLSTCGTSPAVVGNDASGVVTTGTGATACTITFHTAYSANIGCIIKGQAAADPTVGSITTSAITLSTAAASTKYFYECRDH